VKLPLKKPRKRELQGEKASSICLQTVKKFKQKKVRNRGIQGGVEDYHPEKTLEGNSSTGGERIRFTKSGARMTNLYRVWGLTKCCGGGRTKTGGGWVGKRGTGNKQQRGVASFPGVSNRAGQP